jgi:lipoprotein-anchoring transpeptidase ErfK/SrfK
MWRGTVCLVFATLPLLGCSKATPSTDPPSLTLSEPVGASSAVKLGARAPEGDRLAALAMSVPIFERPDTSSKRRGYLRLGAIVPRVSGRVDGAGCKEGFYSIAPKGYVCANAEVTFDVSHPLVRAASVRPDLSKPLPYKYVFVRAVAPQYLRVPTKAQQHKSEFRLDENVAFFSRKGKEVSRVVAGANDVALPGRPAPVRLSKDMTFGELFGAQAGAGPFRAENDGFDPVPFWLEKGRIVPNVSSFKVPETSVFADRVRRHTGLAVVSAFEAADGDFKRAFAVTTDLRMVPISKLKPDMASAFHGVELGSELGLPLAFVRPCDKSKHPCPHPYREDRGAMRRDAESLAARQLVALSGKTKRVGDNVYRETKDGRFLRAEDVALAAAPQDLPAAARAGERWVDVSIENQTLVLWEGDKPIYATLVSTGQDGMGDPKTSKSTPRGTFRIKSKHATATMDSNEHAAEAPRHDESGRPLRRGEGLFELRDVPYVAYFEAGYALHAVYWHDAFGVARSHGCVNLAPIDAQRVFQFIGPELPAQWHGVNVDDREGSTIVVRP